MNNSKYNSKIRHFLNASMNDINADKKEVIVTHIKQSMTPSNPKSIDLIAEEDNHPYPITLDHENEDSADQCICENNK